MAKNLPMPKADVPKVEVKDAPFPLHVITVPNKDPAVLVGKVRPKSSRMKRWTILLSCDGETVSSYYKKCRDAGIPCTANNPRLAVTKGIVKINPPAATAETTTDVAA